MLSVILEDRRDPEGLIRTLSSLFPAIGEGVVRDGMVLSESPAREISAIADQAGCDLLAGALSQTLPRALAQARCDHVLLLRAGAALESEWWRDAAKFIERCGMARPRAAVFSLSKGGFGLGQRLAEYGATFCSQALGRPDPRQGLLAPVAMLSGRAGEGNFPPRFAGRPVRLRARAFVSA